MKTVATAAALAMLAIVATPVCSPVSVARAAAGAGHPLEPLSAAELQRTHGLVRAPPVGIDTKGTRVLAGVHQHFLGYRLDLDVDGPDNAVFRSDMGPLAVSGFPNAFAARETALTREGHHDVNPASARTWHVKSASRRNALGEFTGYELVPGETAVPYSSPGFPPLAKAAFATHQLWVTRHRDGELYAAGDFPSQGGAGAGLPSFITPPEDLAPRSDVVVWYTAGFSHVPRPEDHPVMPTESIGFRLVPHGFFARNPALDVP